MRKVVAAIVLLSALATAALAVKLVEDAPVVKPPKAGDITGSLGPAEKISQVQLVCRATDKRYSPAELDKKTGKFRFKDVPGDETYDLIVTTTDGRGIEGVNLEYADARMLRLAAQRREQLNMPPETSHAFTMDDAQALLKWVRDLQDFMEIRRVLYVQGHGRRATMLVELLRGREFYAQQGDQVIWRVELWYFEYNHGNWERTMNQERVLRRERIAFADWRKIDVEYFPQLSVHIDADGTSKPLAFAIPDKRDPARGRVAGTEQKLATEPFIMGVEPATRVASQPAE